ncbi:MAG TPA: GDP-L-fucose synthase [Anaerolineales bacterium]|nr:GDP-L-fucose synthase [Anaerolineales bacterium]
MNLENKRVTVTGGRGFLGHNIVRILRVNGVEVSAPQHGEYDLREKEAVRKMLSDTDPQIVIHCAAKVGGIGFNKERPGETFYDNALMGINMMEGASRYGVQKYVQLGTVCAYPKHTPEPFKEENLWNGYPEETNAPYGVSKRMLITMADAYRQQYGLNTITLLPVNLYGPGDHFEPEKSHVIPALIRKFHEAVGQGLNSVTLWGTGQATREFLYVRDAARAVVSALQHYDGAKPVNIGSGQSISIHHLAGGIADKIGYYGEIKFDSSMPDGQPRRQLDTTKAKELFGFEATTSLCDGLDATIQWYKECAKYL